jgi:hypothetical protein
MSNILTINLDTLTAEQGQRFAGLILAFAGYEDGDTPEVQYAGKDEPHVENPTSLDPTAVFDNPVAAFSPTSNMGEYVPAPVVSSLGPVLQMPNPSTSAASSATQTVAPVAVTAQTDKAGLPWDGRIHSAAKSMNADGTWRAKKGIDKAYLAQIQEELRRVMAIPSPLAPAPTAVAPPPPASVATTVAAPAPPPPLPPAPNAQIVMEPALMAQLHSAFVDLMGRTSAAMAANKISEEQVLRICQSVGITSLPMLGVRLDLVPSTASMIDAIVMAQA